MIRRRTWRTRPIRCAAPTVPATRSSGTRCRSSRMWSMRGNGRCCTTRKTKNHTRGLLLRHLLHRPHIHCRMLAAGQRAVQKLESRRPVQSAGRLQRAMRLQIASPVMLARKRQRPFQQSSSQPESTPIRRNIQFLQLARIFRPRPCSDTDPTDDNAVRTEIVRTANVCVVTGGSATIRHGIAAVATAVSISGTAAIPGANPLNRNPIRSRSFQSRVILRQPVQLRVAVRGTGPIQPRILQTPADRAQPSPRHRQA